MLSGIKRAAIVVVNAIVMLALSVLALSVFTQVVMRYLLSSPPFWTEELARFLLIWLTFIGIAAVQISRGQIGVTWISGMLPPMGQRILAVINSLIVLVVLMATAWAGYSIALLGSQTSPAMGISMRFIYGALPLGAVATLIVVIVQLVEEITAVFAGEAEHGD